MSRLISNSQCRDTLFSCTDTHGHHEPHKQFATGWSACLNSQAAHFHTAHAIPYTISSPAGMHSCCARPGLPPATRANTNWAAFQSATSMFWQLFDGRVLGQDGRNPAGTRALQSGEQKIRRAACAKCKLPPLCMRALESQCRPRGWTSLSAGAGCLRQRWALGGVRTAHHPQPSAQEKEHKYTRGAHRSAVPLQQLPTGNTVCNGPRPAQADRQTVMCVPIGRQVGVGAHRTSTQFHHASQQGWPGTHMRSCSHDPLLDLHSRPTLLAEQAVDDRPCHVELLLAGRTHIQSQAAASIVVLGCDAGPRHCHDALELAVDQAQLIC